MRTQQKEIGKIKLKMIRKMNQLLPGLNKPETPRPRARSELEKVNEMNFPFFSPRFLKFKLETEIENKSTKS
jgi:hypothetical protein